MKYYIGKIEEINGEMEYKDSFLFSTKGNPDKYIHKVAKDWRGDGEWDKHHEAWWVDCTLIRDDGYQEIPKEDYDVMSKYLAVL